MAGGNPTRWKQIWIPEELAKDLEDTAIQSGLSTGEAATLLIIAGAHAMYKKDAQAVTIPSKEQDATGTSLQPTEELRPEPGTTAPEQG